MNTKVFRRIAVAAAIALGPVLAGPPPAQAVPINGLYLEDARCDPLLSQTLSHELGGAAVFPTNEAFLVQTFPTPGVTVCVADDSVANDWTVQITNVSGIQWKNLFFVGDLGTKVGNADGSMMDLLGAPGLLTDAFRIDGTVTLGINNNLLGESGGLDEFFDPGETWRFNVSNFVDAVGGAPAPIFITPGKFAGSSPPSAASSNASILAIPVPEPGSFGVIGLLAAGLLIRRPRRA